MSSVADWWRPAGAAAALLLGLAGVVPAALAQHPAPFFWGVQVERLEHRFADGADVLAWDGDALLGGDEWKLRLQSEGEYDRAANGFETLEHQLLVQRMISDFFDVKAGVRYDTPAGPDRAYAVLGVQGLAPQWFEVDADLFLGERGDASARLDVEYELLLTNRLILTPSVEADFAFSDDRAIGVGSGLVSTEFGVRLSYDLLDRSIAPYVGVHYERKFGSTRRLASEEGESTSHLLLVAGVRLRF